MITTMSSKPDACSAREMLLRYAPWSDLELIQRTEHLPACLGSTQAVIYVVDSADRERIPTSRAELLSLLAEEELQDCKLLVFANKQDQPNAMSAAEVSEALGLHTLKGRQWTIMKSCAIKGEGLDEGMDWSGGFDADMLYH